MRIFQKKFFRYGSIGILLGIFFFFWLSVQNVVSTPQGGGWLFPIGIFSFGVTLLCFEALLSKENNLLFLMAFVSFLPGLILLFSWISLGFVCIGTLLCFIGFSSMRKAMRSHIRIHARKIVQHGIGWIVVAFAFALSLFYYESIRFADGNELLTRLEIERTSHTLLTKSIGFINQDFKKADKEHVSVNEFLMALQKNQSLEDISLPVPSDEELLQIAGLTSSDPRASYMLLQMRRGFEKTAVHFDMSQLALDQSRKKLSSIAGVSLTGEEPIADILSQIVDQRMRTYFQPSEMTGASPSTLLPFILAIILFVTLWSLGSMLAFVWSFLTAMLFFALRRSGWIVVKTVPVEQEVIV